MQHVKHITFLLKVLPPHHCLTDPELVNDDHPSGKIWSVYVSEAEKEDRALAEGWKGDMEGLLIFVRNPLIPYSIGSLIMYARLGCSQPA